MKIVDLFENYDDDKYYYTQAENVYNDIVHMFNQGRNIEDYQYGGTVVTDNADNKYLVFPVRTNEIGYIYFAFGSKDAPFRASTGTRGSSPLIVISLLKDPPTITEDNLKQLKSPLIKSSIIHEIIHIIDKDRYSDTYNQPYDVSKLEDFDTPETIKYYNSAMEINARFHEVITSVKSYENANSAESIVQHFDTVPKLVNFLYNDSFRDADKWLTHKNKQSIKKRISRVAHEMIQNHST